MGKDILLRIVKRFIFGLSDDERLKRTTLEMKANYISELKWKFGKTVSADNKLNPWEYDKDEDD